ncbi:N-acyl-D-amino-acid deacylase family protein [Georgenia sp. MJ170]|uniref:N-acyl-D-amino-acid deacylase family protein n=1 Tax=Georgenia sunbinii TaxID=3117728 RepID=UPI002F268D3D
MNLETIMRGGTVVDGTGSAGVVADVGLRAGRIEVVGDLAGVRAELELDVTDQVVAPGFVDVHTHSDLTTFLPDDAEEVKLAAVRQGVTSEVVGNCGWTPFPTVPERRELIRDHITAVFGGAAQTFGTVAEYRAAMADRAMPTHLAPLIGHGTIRAAVLGLGRVASDPSSVAMMGRVLEQALDEGAFGMSSGLVYPPGVYSRTEELVALGSVLERRGSIYATHMRNEMELVAGAVEEGIAVARRTGVPVQLSHIKVAGRERWGTVGAVIDQIDRAVADGLDVRGDVYPYTAGSTMLRAILPPWVNAGGIDAMLAHLADPRARQRIAAEYVSGLPEWQNFAAAAGWDGIVIAGAPARREIEGRSIADLAQAWGQEPADVVAAVLTELRGDVLVVLHMMSEGDVRLLLATPEMLIGSDTIPLPGRPHPRTAGTFARVLGRYVRDEQVTDLPAMIRRMTSVPAERFRLGRRGVVAPGYAADLAVFDPQAVADRATFDEPLLAPIGIRHVLVDGRAVILDGADTGIRPGRVLEPAG